MRPLQAFLSKSLLAIGMFGVTAVPAFASGFYDGSFFDDGYGFSSGYSSYSHSYHSSAFSSYPFFGSFFGDFDCF